MKKKKRKLKKGSKLLLLIVILPIIYYFNHELINNYLMSWKLGYPEKTIVLFKEEDVFDYVKERKYSKTVETAINSDDFEHKYLEKYYNIDYVNSDNFIHHINSLLTIGYSEEEINTMYKSLDEDKIMTILNYSYNNDLINYLSLTYFKKDYLDRYLAFYNNKNKLSFSFYKNEIDESILDYHNIVTYVNVGLDTEYYANYEEITNPNSITVLVNKYHKLANDFVPSNLEKIASNCAYGNQQLVSEAKKSLEEMCNYMHTLGLYIYATSTYRSYNYQTELYNYYVKNDGQTVADTYSARPGFSEHQTGLAVDVGSNSNSTFVYTDEYKWLIDNAHKYGFVLRFPEDKEFITGYMFESWHYRYLGIELATNLYENNLTYDEYIARQ